jgi:predicted transcriptional regulator
MTNTKKDETGSKTASGVASIKAEPTPPTPKDVKSETASILPVATASASPVPPLAQATAARVALDDAINVKIVEALNHPGANMTRIAAEMGVSYNTVQSIRSKLQKASGGPEQRRATAPGRDLEKQLLRLENDYLKRPLAIFEPESISP